MIYFALLNRCSPFTVFQKHQKYDREQLMALRCSKQKTDTYSQINLPQLIISYHFQVPHIHQLLQSQSCYLGLIEGSDQYFCPQILANHQGTCPTHNEVYQHFSTNHQCQVDTIISTQLNQLEQHSTNLAIFQNPTKCSCQTTRPFILSSWSHHFTLRTRNFWQEPYTYKASDIFTLIIIGVIKKQPDQNQNFLFSINSKLHMLDACFLLFFQYQFFIKWVFELFQQQIFIFNEYPIFNDLPINRKKKKFRNKNYMQKQKQSLINIQSLPKRTKGNVESSFKRILIESNRFKVDVSKLQCLCIFAIRFAPDIKQSAKPERDSLMKKIMPQIKEMIHQPIIKDGLIFSHQQPKATDKTFTSGKYVVLIRQIKRFNAVKNPQMLLYFLGNVLRKVMNNMNFVEVGNSRKFISMSKFIEIQSILIYSGFKVCFEMLENGYFLNVDSTKKIVRNQSVLEYINYLYKSNTHMERDQKRQFVRQNMLNKIVMTNYGKTRYLEVQEVQFIDLTQVTVKIGGVGFSLIEYYKVQYHIQIQNLKQPLLVTNTKRVGIKTYLIPELCLMTGIPQNFDETKHKRITDISKLATQKRKEDISGFVRQMLKNDEDLTFEALGVSISPEFFKVQAKLIPPPKIILGNNKLVASGRQSSFSMQQVPIYKVKNVVKLGIIVFDGVDSTFIVQYFSNTFKALKIKVSMSIFKMETLGKRGLDNIENFVQMAKSKQDCNICLIIIPNKMKQNYNKLKQLTLLQKQLGCQIVLQSTLKIKNIQSVASKILLQVLAKAGNTLWITEPCKKKQKVMIIAFSSNSTNRAKVKNITVGICATLDELHSQIFSKTRKFSQDHEEFNNMKQLLLEALSEYKKRNSYLPEDIIILENKKSEKSQACNMQFFIQPAIQFMEQLYGSKRPKIIFIYVVKCLNDRFFWSSYNNCTNPPIGTLINSQVTSSKFDFYLIAHNSTKCGGSIIPFNYKVVFSDSSIQQGTLQSLLFSQCFNYCNYTGAIKHPAMLQYAIKCTKFGADVLYNVQVSNKMNYYPYFI